MGQSIHGFYLEVQTAASPEAWSKIGEIVTLGWPGISHSDVPNTSSLSTAEQWLPHKLKRFSEVPCTVRFNPADASNKHFKETKGLLKIAEDASIELFRISSGPLNGLADVEAEFEAYIKDFQISEMDADSGEWTADFTLRPTGEVAYAANAAE